MNRIKSLIVTLVFLVGVFTPVQVNARSASPSDIGIKAEYLIKDNDGLHTRYVVLATNNSDSDITITASFHAISSNGAVIKTVFDNTESVKRGQDFIIYGQFRNEIAAAASSFKYDLNINENNCCNYDAIGLDISEDEDRSLTITGTNYSKTDVNAVNVRGIFYKDGTPIAFDTTNIADTSYTLRSGNSGSQQLCMVPVDYDNYVITYSASSVSPVIAYN
ncbi:hypothetical protein [Butyrivibrio sp. WCD3002]|uniref:hypothetical protein n=1 Tax=Butyrivibrio sp. WCD3002 TaxID=1280676 RepID=UPI00040A1473|nr:hypothetical protein [Butyrivibrio sp. WCD3002]